MLLFKRVLELNPADYDACFEVAALYEQAEPATALPFYERGIQVMKQQINTRAVDRSPFVDAWQSSFAEATALPELAASMVPPELLNNVAVLLLEVKRPVEAEVYLREAA